MRPFRIAAVVLMTAGCVGTEALVSSKADGRGTAVEYPVTRDQAFDICVAILRWEVALALDERRAFLEKGDAERAPSRLHR